MMKKKTQHNQQAISMKFDPEKNGAPIITSVGEGELANRILELAREHKVPIVQDPGLVQALSHAGLGQEIPVNLYRAVAAIYSVIRRTDLREEEKSSGER